MAPDVDERIDQLYTLPPGRFVAARNALAKELKSAGDRDLSEQVRTLEKPTVAAWVVNQLARREAKPFAELLDIGERLREAQRKAVSGSDAHAALEVATEERHAVRGLVEKARPLLEDAGVSGTPVRLEKVADILYALAADEGARELATRGRLTHDLRRAGFGDMPFSDEGSVPAEPTKRKQDRDRRKRAERDVRDLEAKAERAADEVERLRRQATDARKAAERAEREADQAAATAEDLKDQVEQARAALADLDD